MTTDDDSVFYAVLHGLADAMRNPDRGAGGLIGKAATIVDALGLDGDMTMRELRRAVKKSASPKEGT